MSTQHTPTPWEAHGSAIHSAHGAVAGATLSKGSREASANATHIVRCVNAHDDLVAALKPFAHVPCERRGNIHCTMLPADSGVKLCAPCAARAALAKVSSQVQP